jgi:hypothetical protein
MYTISNDCLAHNLEHFTSNFSVHSIDTRRNNQESNQKGLYFTGINILNKLPASTAALVKDKKHFVLTLKRFLTGDSFYSINNYLNYQHKINTNNCSKRKEL